MADIDISAITRRKTFSGSAGTGPYACTFEITAEADIAVYKNATLLTLTTDYTVTIAGNGTFSVTLAVAATGSDIVTVIGAKPIARSTEFSTGGDFLAATLNTELDAIVIFIQQVLDRADRALKANFSDDIALDMTLPATATRASKFLAFNSDGEPIASAGTSGQPASTFADTLLDDTTAAEMRTTIDAAQAIGSLTVETTVATDDKVYIGDTSESGAANAMTVENIFKVVNAFTADALPDRTADYVLAYDASASGPKKVLMNAFPLPRMYISGLTYSNNSGDANNDIDIAVGSCRDGSDTDNLILAAALTKRIDAAWAVGTNQGGLDGTESVAGTPDTSTWYYLWLIKRSDTGVVDALFSESASSPTMPSNYDKKRLIGAVYNNSGGNLDAFHVYENEGGGIDQMWDVPTLDVNQANALTTSRRTDAVKVPTSFSVIADLNIAINDASATGIAVICCPDQADAAPSTSAAPLSNVTTVGTVASHSNHMKVRTSTTGTIAARASLTADLYAVVTNGFSWARRN